MSRALRAEWTKLRTAPDTAWLPLVAGILTVGLGSAVSAAAAPGTTACASGCDAARLGLSGVYLGQLAVVLLAVLAITGEHHTGLLRVTLAATPNRLTVFGAKAGALLASTLPAGVLGVSGSLLTARILLPANGFAFAVGSGPMLRAALGTVLYLGLVALFSFGLATALRHTAPALITVLALLYLAPLLARFVPDERWQLRLERYAPMSAGLAVQGAGPIGPWAGLAVLAAQAAAALAIGAVLFHRRDA